MISKKELEAYSRMRNMRTLGHAELDYFQNILLFLISQKYGKTLIFKGGTALNKCFGLDRFSEDLDFTAEEKINIDYIEEGLKRFKIDYALEKEEYKESESITIRMKGPLYIGIKTSMCKLMIDISLREKVMLAPEIKSIGRFLEEIPAFDINVMSEREIFAEKVRAIIAREKARDVYDLHFLIKKGNGFNLEIIEKKLSIYGKKWNKKEFLQKVRAKESIWKPELKLFAAHIPEFKEVIEDIAKAAPE